MPLTRLVMLGGYAKRLGKKSRHTVRFQPGVNLLIGPNGSGKSTIIECLMKEVLTKEKRGEYGEKLRDQKRYATYDFKGKPLSIFAFDFEKQNPRVRRPGYIGDLDSIRMMSLNWKYSMTSHGEFVRDVLANLDAQLKKTKGRACVIMDEPEQALDLEAVDLLRRYLERPRSKHKLAQAIIATHHPFLIANPGFHKVELEKGYTSKVLDSLRRASRGIQ